MLRATFKSLLARKLRLALTALSVTLGVAFVAGTLVLSDTMTATFDQLYAGLTKGTDVTVRGTSAFTDTSTLGATKPIPADLERTVRQVPGVAAAEGSVTGYALMLDKNGEPIQPGGAPTLGASFHTKAELAGGFTMREGHGPTTPDEVVVDAGTAKKYGYHAGDPITIMFLGGPRQFTVAGVAGFGEADNLAGATVASFQTATAQRLLGKQGKFDQIDVQAASGTSADALRDRIAAALPSGTEAVTSETVVDESSTAIREGLGFFTKALLGFAAISLLVGGFIIWNTFSILIAQRTRELALLRAIGASRGQVRASVLAEAGVVGLVASAVGLGAGVGVAAGLRQLLHAVGIDVPSTTLQVLPRTVAAAFAVGVLVTLVAALAPAHRATRVPPIAALRDAAPSLRPLPRWRTYVGLALTAIGAVALTGTLVAGKGVALAGIGVLATFAGVLTLAPLIAQPLTRALGAPLARYAGTAGRLARQNALRSPRRTAATATALTIGLALVATVTVVASSMKASVSEVIDNASRADFILKPASQVSPGLPPQVATELRAAPGVGTVAELRYGVARVDGSSAAVAGLDPTTAPKVANLDVRTGSLDRLGDGAVIVSTKAAKAGGWSVGDQVPVQFAQTGVQRLTVAGTYASSALIGTDYLVTLQTYNRNFSDRLDAVVLVTKDAGADTAAVKRAVEQAVAAYPNAQVDDATSFKETQSANVDQLLGIVTVLLLLAVIIALLGIVNTLALSVFERTRELGLLRAVGMTRRQVRAVVRWEAVIVAVLGALLGAVLGIAFGTSLTRALADQGLSVVAVPGGRLTLYVLLAGIAGVLAAIGPARRASRVDVLRAVVSE